MRRAKPHGISSSFFDLVSGGRRRSHRWPLVADEQPPVAVVAVTPKAYPRTMQADSLDLVPVLALVFTVASFWWIYLRRGRLSASAPDSYASVLSESMTRIRLPLVIYNSGAATLVVDSLRLVIEDHQFEWISVRESLKPHEDDFVDFAAPFPVGGRGARRIFAEFGENPPVWSVGPGRTYQVRVEHRAGDRWKELATFNWSAPNHDLKAYIAHRNGHGELC